VTAPAPGRIHTDAAIQAIETLIEARASRVLVGRGEPPNGSGFTTEPGDAMFIPYVVVYPYSGTPDGSVAEPAEYLDYRAQATCVGASQEGAEAVADLVKAAWVNTTIPVAGRFCYRGQVLVDTPVTRDDAEAPPVHFAVLQVTWRTQAI
jgi:hypothetical protein